MSNKNAGVQVTSLGEKLFPQFLPLIDQLIAEHLHEDTYYLQHKARMTVGLGVSCLGANVILVPLLGFLLGIQHPLFWINLGLVFAHSANLAIFKHTQSLTMASIGLTTAIFAATVSAVFFADLGISKELITLPWITFPLLLGMLLRGPTLAFSLLGATLLALLAFLMVSHPSFSLLEVALPFILISSFAGLLFVVGWVFHSTSSMTLDALHSAFENQEKTSLELAASLENQEKTNLELAKAIKIAEEASSTKSIFLANMSHELRTPLNAIIGYSELLQEELIDYEVVELQPDLQKIHAAGNNLLVLVNEILDLSKIEAGKLEPAPCTFGLRSFLDQLTQTLHPLQEKNKNELVIEIDEELGQLYTDPQRLRQCLFNLFSNAFKFTQEGTVTLQVKSLKKEGEPWIRFVVKDDGIGIPEEHLDKLFQEFSQADANISRAYGGTGLGLAITQKLVALLGGEVTLESKLGEGSTFFLSLPVGKE